MPPARMTTVVAGRLWQGGERSPVEHVGALRGLIEGQRRLGVWKRRLMDDPSQIMQAYVATASAVG